MTDGTRPLDRALEQIADGAGRAHASRAAAGAGLDLRVVRASARRRRVRFEAGVGVAGAALVAVTLLAAGALQGSDGPAPPAQSDGTSVRGAGVTCGSRLDALPVPPEGSPDVSVRVEVTEPSIEVGDPLDAVVTSTVAMDPSERLTSAFAVWLVRDGVVVGRPAPGWTNEKRLVDAQADVRVEERVMHARFVECDGDDDATSVGPGDYGLVAVVSEVRVGVSPASTPFLSNLAAVRVGGAAAAARDGEEWTARFVGDEGWRDVDPAEVPGDLPLALEDADEVIQSQAYEDGVRWRVTVSHAGGRDTYELVRDALVAAGYTEEDVTTDPERPAWTAATFTRGAVVVLVDTSNETGGGFFTTFLLEASW